MADRFTGGGRLPMGYRLSAARVPPARAGMPWDVRMRRRRRLAPQGMAEASAYWQTERRQILKAYESQLEGILQHVRDAIANLDDADVDENDEVPPPYVIRGRFEPQHRHRAPATRDRPRASESRERTPVKAAPARKRASSRRATTTARSRRNTSQRRT
jgi:hypothetical protein